MTSGGRIVRGGFGLLAAQPLAVLVWTIFYVATAVALAFAVRLGLPVEPPPGAANDPVALAMSFGSSLLLYLVNMCLYVIVLTAAMRSVLQRSRPAFAFLRLGADELRLFALVFFFMILFYVGLLVAVILLAVVTALFLTAFGTGPAATAALIVDAAMVFMLAAWLFVRLSLSLPLTLLRGSFTISESWRLTRGRFWTLFGGFFLIYLVVLLIIAGIVAATMGDYLAELAQRGVTDETLDLAARHQMARQLGPIDLPMLLGWLASGVGSAVGVGLQGGAFAAAARDLVDVQAEMAETFA
ncbi:MAG: hypothetical protein JO276_08180 [Sphingomonadaceae bacterium]|nr:hypothetical protein [Sphingomonadaceae bacterium]